MNTTRRYYYILIKMSKFEKAKHVKCWHRDGGIEHSYSSWEHKIVKPLWKRVWQCKKSEDSIFDVWSLTAFRYSSLSPFCPHPSKTVRKPSCSLRASRKFKLCRHCQWEPSLQPYFLDAKKAKVTQFASSTGWTRALVLEETFLCLL